MKIDETNMAEVMRRLKEKHDDLVPLAKDTSFDHAMQVNQLLSNALRELLPSYELCVQALLITARNVKVAEGFQSLLNEINKIKAMLGDV